MYNKDKLREAAKKEKSMNLLQMAQEKFEQITQMSTEKITVFENSKYAVRLSRTQHGKIVMYILDKNTVWSLVAILDFTGTFTRA